MTSLCRFPLGSEVFPVRFIGLLLRSNDIIMCILKSFKKLVFSECRTFFVARHPNLFGRLITCLLFVLFFKETKPLGKLEEKLLGWFVFASISCFLLSFSLKIFYNMGNLAAG